MKHNLPGNPHAQEAVDQYEYVGESWQAEEGITDATMLAAAIHTQALATLALAHEQRTANLIEWCREDSRAHPDDIARRLGLDGDPR